MKFSLRNVIISGLFVGVTLLVGMIIISSYYSSKKAMIKHANTIMNTISEFALDKSQNYLNIAKDAAYLTQKLESKNVVSSKNKELMIQYFYEQLQINKQFSSIYYANNNGEFMMLLRLKNGYMFKHTFEKENTRISKKQTYDIYLTKILTSTTEKDTYDPRTRSWYNKALEEKKLIWTSPYVFYTLQTLGITTASPIYNNQDEIQGVVGVDIEIKELSNFIANLKISKNGKVFMMNKDEKMIAFPNLSTIKYDQDTNKFYLKTIQNLGDPIALEVYNQIKKRIKENPIKEKIFSTYTSKENITYHSLFLPMQTNGINWIIGMYLPEDDYLEAIKENQIFNIVITLIFACLFLAVGYFIAKSIINPIQNLQDKANELKKLNLNSPDIESTIYKEINDTIEATNKMKHSLKEAYTDTLFRLAMASEYKDLDTANHIKRVGYYCVEIARELGLEEEDFYILEHASCMHDIGKLGIDDSILLKPGKLTASERIEVEKHSELGANILENPTSKIMEEARKIALYHHEKYDGGGYPHGLQGEEIPLYARIVAVADVFDALVSKRCYKDDYPAYVAKDIILEGYGSHFDPNCVEAFERAFEKLVEIHNKYKD